MLERREASAAGVKDQSLYWVEARYASSSAIVGRYLGFLPGLMTWGLGLGFAGSVKKTFSDTVCWLSAIGHSLLDST